MLAYSRGELRKSVITLYKAIVILAAFVSMFSVVLLVVSPGKIKISNLSASPASVKGVFATTLIISVYNLAVQSLLGYGFMFVSRRVLRWHLRLNYLGFVMTAAIAVFVTIQLDQQGKYCDVQSESADPAEFTKDCEVILVAYNAAMTPLWIASTVLLMLVYVGSVGLDRLEAEVEEFYFLRELEEQRISAEETKEDLLRLYKEGLSPAKHALSEHLATTSKIIPRIAGKGRGRKIAIVYEPYPPDEPDHNTNSKKNIDLLHRLKRLQTDLEQVGARVELYPGNEELDRDKVEEMDNVLLICTPSFKYTAASTELNPLLRTLFECFQKQNINPEFIIPLIFDGGFPTAVPDIIHGKKDRTISTIIIIDMSADKLSYAEYDKKYAKAMSNLAPLGLVPTIFFLKHDNDYRVSGANLEMQLNNIEADDDDSVHPSK
eukprot:TRINITY_DN3316_c0_g1_i2.p1 TRINITY_DN3316_c0_g1~~TRINITY_DN3316_c0_g1_i2.p1  ORF type:complete len:434 (+),score=102.50 TRINITY_DN3316_c0_g1_i2:117-1418(+)